MLNLVKPKGLQPGDKIAAITLSWGGPGQIPHRYEIGKRQLEDTFGVKVVEAKHALREPDWLDKNPKARADDLMECFADSTIKGIFSTIGGNDSVRILPFVDLAVIKDHPKIFMGYSDSTITHVACLNAGIRSFYGPSFMAGFAENEGMFPYMMESVRKTLFTRDTIGALSPNKDGWTVERLEWSNKANQSIKRKLNPVMGWRFLQGGEPTTGPLIGGCADVLEFLKGSQYWPAEHCWERAILFLETSEDAIPPWLLRDWLRNYGTIGILEKINGLLFGRPGGEIPPEQFGEYDDVLIKVVRDEFGRDDIPIVTRMDFGHTDPMFVLPYGARVTVDPVSEIVSINESGVETSPSLKKPTDRAKMIDDYLDSVRGKTE